MPSVWNLIGSLFTLMPCPFTGPKTFYSGPNILSQHKNLTAFSASSKNFVPAQKPILLKANYLFVRHKMFVSATKWKWISGLALKIWTNPKHLGTCKRTRQYIYVVVRIRNQSLYIRTAIISVIIYNDRYFWFLYIMANFFQSVYIMTEIIVCLWNPD